MNFVIYPLRKFPIGIPIGKIPIRISDKIPIGKIPIGIPIGKIPIGILSEILIGIFPIGIFPIGNLDKKDEIYHYSSKEHPIISKIATFGCKML